MTNRTIQYLIKGWDTLTNDDEMVAFIDGLTADETKMLDQAIRLGLLAKEPPYITQQTVV
jgi:uncharacterized protein YerC